MPNGQTIFRARHVATMTAAGVIDDGCVVVDDAGWISAVGRTRDVNPLRIDVDIDGLLTPGLVNAHTHLELTNVPRPPSPGTFQDWLRTTMAASYDPELESFTKKRVAAVQAGIGHCLRFGVTTVGDVTQASAITRPVLAASPLRAISYGECLGLGPRRSRFDALLARATDWDAAGPRMMIGVSPHAPYTVDGESYTRADQARREELDSFWCTHLAETPDESAFIARRAGPFAELYRRLGFDPGVGDGFEGSPLDWLDRRMTFSSGDLLVHMNYCSDDDLEKVAANRSIVAWCPRTHAYFDHPPHRWRDMLARGIRVCVATDSCASSPDLNVMDDLRLVRQQSPDVSAELLWRMVTRYASEVFMWPVYPVGQLELLAQADFCAWPTRTDDPLAEVLDTPGMLPNGVWIGGRLVPSPSIPGEG